MSLRDLKSKEYYLIVMFDLEYEMVNHSLRHIHLTINEQTKRDKVGVPVIQLRVRIITIMPPKSLQKHSPH